MRLLYASSLSWRFDRIEAFLAWRKGTRNAETIPFVFCAGRRAAVRAGNRGGIAGGGLLFLGLQLHVHSIPGDIGILVIT